MRSAIATCGLVVCLLVVGCSTPGSESQQTPAGAMGMGGGSVGAMATGVVASAKNAGLRLAPAASTKAGIAIAEVRAPSDGWVVVRSSTPPGAVLGSTWVPKGLSRDVVVGLTAASDANIRISLHVDRGRPKVLDYDPTKPERSADKPVVVNRAALEEQLTLDALGVDVVPNTALLKVEDQGVEEGAITVDYLLLPGASWISVNAVEEGLPGARVGLASRGAGELQEVRIPVKPMRRPLDVIVTVHVDRGALGKFEYKLSDPLGSVDQPYKSAGVIVSRRVRLE